MQRITVLMRGPFSEAIAARVAELRHDPLVAGFLLLTPAEAAAPPAPIPEWVVNNPAGGICAARVVSTLQTPFVLWLDPRARLVPGALARLIEVATSSRAGLVYADYADQTDAGLRPHPLADHQEGSLTEGFDLGPAQLWSLPLLREAQEKMGGESPHLRYLGWYELRLKLSAHAPIVRLPELLATVQKEGLRASGAAVFDYLTAGRALQVEAEQIATEYLRQRGALVGPARPFTGETAFPVEASVVIPVKNRARTVADAVRSALAQKTDFSFNVVIVNNHSTDDTGQILDALAAEDARVHHLVPDRIDLGIGGCWNYGVQHAGTGRYSVQLDSDDLYSADDVLQRVVDALREGRCGMVVGSYETVNFDLQPILPGLIDHREWTDENGANNALRVNGFGAPRAFATELLRRYPFPNVSYGEDYAVALRISREYRVGRIYTSLYHCRRWEDNTDADLAPDVVAKHQLYKDRVRSLELAARIAANREGEA